MVLTATRNPIVELEKSPFIFHETGSRYFGTATSASDYDFFADYSEELIHWLESNDYERLDHTYYNDPFIRCVYRRDNVDVQLVSSAHDKAEVQNMLYQTGILETPRSKAESRMVWITAFHMFNMVRSRIAANFASAYNSEN